MIAASCESCGMPFENPDDYALGDEHLPLCRFCTDSDGNLQPFEERLEQMTQWTMRQDGIDQETANTKTREYMRGMPAWRDHPALKQ